MPRLNHFFSSNLRWCGVRYDVFFGNGAEPENPWSAVDPAPAARLGRRQHDFQGSRHPAARLGHHIWRRLLSHLGLLGGNLDGIRVLLVDLGVDVLLGLHLVLVDALHGPQTLSGYGKGLRVLHKERSCGENLYMKIVMTVKLSRVPPWILKNI